MPVNCRACSLNCNSDLFDLRVKVFFQKKEAAFLAKHYHGNGEPCTGKCLSSVPDVDN